MSADSSSSTSSSSTPVTASHAPNKGSGLPRSSDPASPKYRIERYPFFLMSHALGRYNRRMERALRAIDSDQPHWRILMILGQYGTTAVSRIADLAVLKLSTVTRIIQRMARDGLVITATSTRDRRVTEVTLTENGWQALEEVRRVAGRIAREAFAEMDRSEVETLIEILAKLDTRLEG